MPTLYEITEELRALQQAIQEADDLPAGEIPEKLLGWMQDIDEKHDKKIDAYCAVIREAEYVEKAARAEAARVTLIAQQNAGRIARMKEVLFNHMREIKTNALVTMLNRVTIQKNGGKPAIEILDESLLPEELFIAQEPKPDKEAIRIKLENGEDVPGARIKEYGYSIRIR